MENRENTENTESRLEQMLLIGSFDGWELVSTTEDDYPDQTWLTFEKVVGGKGGKGSEDIMKYHTSVCVTPEPKYNTLEETKKFKREFAKYLEYDTSWDSLMPVIRQIGFLGKNPPIELLMWIRNNKTIFDLKLTEVEIEEAYLETVKFIKWYNGISDVFNRKFTI